MADETEKSDIEKGDKAGNGEDQELSELLDSALEDLTLSESGKKSNDKELTQTKRPDNVVPPDSLWNEEFFNQASARLEHNIQALLSPGGGESVLSAEQLGENIQRLAEAATSAVGGDTSPDTEFSSIMAQALRSLTENTENLQTDFNDPELMNMLGAFNQLADPNNGSNELMPFMQQMMQNLLSKDILYPALSSIVEKYPEWLETNKETLSNSDRERYTEQLRIMKEVCAELDRESSADTSDVKTERFEKVLSLMQKMQDCGQPPAELAGDIGPVLNMDENGMPQLPGGLGSQQCSLM